MTNINETLAVVTIVGFAIQQALQCLDPFVTAFISASKRKGANPGSLSDADFKKAAMTILAVLIGVVVVLVAKIQLLSFVNPPLAGTPEDVIVSALVLSAGTDGFNSLLKYVGYVKDARKAELPKS